MELPGLRWVYRKVYKGFNDLKNIVYIHSIKDWLSVKSFTVPEENVTNPDLFTVAEIVCKWCDNVQHLAYIPVLIDLAPIYGIALSPFSFSLSHLPGKL